METQKNVPWGNVDNTGNSICRHKRQHVLRSVTKESYLDDSMHYSVSASRGSVHLAQTILCKWLTRNWAKFTPFVAGGPEKARGSNLIRVPLVSWISYSDQNHSFRTQHTGVSSSIRQRVFWFLISNDRGFGHSVNCVDFFDNSGRAQNLFWCPKSMLVSENHAKTRHMKWPHSHCSSVEGFQNKSYFWLARKLLFPTE